MKALLCVLVVGVTVAAASTSRPPASAGLGDYVGWYEISPGKFSLVTWGADEGLRIFDFNEPRFEKLMPGDDGRFIWHRGSVASDRVVSFDRNDKGVVAGLHWRVKDGSEGSASKSLDYGYDQEEVTFSSKDATLAGVVLSPRGKGRHPAVAFIQGSGDSDRDNVWAFSIANHFALNGFTVLLPDKRGCGKSTGDWKKANFNDLAADARASVDLLKSRRDVTANHIGLAGLSQGGWIAPIVAAESKDVAFMIDVSGAAVTVGEQIIHEVEQALRKAKVSEEDISYAKNLFGLSVDYLRTGLHWDRYMEALKKAPASVAQGFPTREDDWRVVWNKAVIDFDPVAQLRRVKVPALVVYGENDETQNVPVRESLARLDKLARESPSLRLTVKVFPDTAHAFWDPATKWIRKDFLDFLVTWSRAAGKS